MPSHVADTPSYHPSPTAFVCDAQRPVLTHGRDLDAEIGITAHRHPRGQLLWAAEGVLRVTTETAVWIVPPSHAVWIPGDALHQVTTETAARTRNLYIDATYPVRTSSGDCEMLLLTSLMRELILRLAETPPASEDASHQRLGLVAIDELGRLSSSPLNLPAGRDPRLRRLTSAMILRPAEERSLAALAKDAGGSVRTIERLFQSETGMTFRQWRSRLRLLSAIERIGKNESSTEIAYSLGFRSVSAFVAAFRIAFGKPPQAFFDR